MNTIGSNDKVFLNQVAEHLQAGYGHHGNQ
jgi:hypothetical protein